MSLRRSLIPAECAASVSFVPSCCVARRPFGGLSVRPGLNSSVLPRSLIPAERAASVFNSTVIYHSFGAMFSFKAALLRQTTARGHPHWARGEWKTSAYASPPPYGLAQLLADADFDDQHPLAFYF